MDERRRLAFWGGTGQVNRAAPIGASSGVPAVAVTSNPRVDLGGEPADTGNEEQPSEQIPIREKQANMRPSVCTAPDPALSIDGLHPAHGDFTLDLWEARLSRWIVEIQRFDSVARVKPSQARNAGAAKAAVSVVEYGDVRHGGANGLYLI